MTITTKLAIGTLAVAMFGSSASAQVLLQDNFDGYANQAAFEAAWTPIGTVAPLSGNLSTEQAVSLSYSVKIDGTATTGQQRNQRSFTESGAPSLLQSIVFSFDFYDSNDAAAPYRQYANLQDSTAASATSQLIAMGMNNNQTSANSGGNYYMARILGYTVPTTADPDGGPAESVGGAGAFFKLNDFAVGLRTTGWHNFKVLISTDDALSTDYAFYVDNQLAERVSDIGTSATLRSYDVVRIGSGVSNGSNPAYYDNVQVEVTQVPEPSSLALGLLGGLGLVARRIFRRSRV